MNPELADWIDASFHESKRPAARIIASLWPDLPVHGVAYGLRVNDVQEVLAGRAAPRLSRADREAIEAAAKGMA